MMKQFSLHFGIAVVSAFFCVFMSVSFKKPVAILLFISNGSNIAILFVRNAVAKKQRPSFCVVNGFELSSTCKASVSKLSQPNNAFDCVANECSFRVEWSVCWTYQCAVIKVGLKSLPPTVSYPKRIFICKHSSKTQTSKMNIRLGWNSAIEHINSYDRQLFSNQLRLISQCSFVHVVIERWQREKENEQRKKKNWINHTSIVQCKLKSRFKDAFSNENHQNVDQVAFSNVPIKYLAEIQYQYTRYYACLIAIGISLFSIFFSFRCCCCCGFIEQCRTIHTE